MQEYYWRTYVKQVSGGNCSLDAIADGIKFYQYCVELNPEF
jgi:hypothetical protein